MELPISRKKKSHYFRLISKLAPIPIAVVLIFGKENGAFWPSAEIVVPIVTCVVLSLGVYMWLIRKPYASIESDILIIASVKIKKGTVKSIKYKILSKTEHELHVSIEGYSEWTLRLTGEDVDIKDMAVFNFINRNFMKTEMI